MLNSIGLDRLASSSSERAYLEIFKPNETVYRRAMPITNFENNYFTKN